MYIYIQINYTTNKQKMKLSQFRRIIKEEVRRVLKEGQQYEVGKPFDIEGAISRFKANIGKHEKGLVQSLESEKIRSDAFRPPTAPPKKNGYAFYFQGKPYTINKDGFFDFKNFEYPTAAGVTRALSSITPPYLFYQYLAEYFSETELGMKFKSPEFEEKSKQSDEFKSKLSWNDPAADLIKNPYKLVFTFIRAVRPDIIKYLMQKKIFEVRPVQAGVQP